VISNASVEWPPRFERMPPLPLPGRRNPGFEPQVTAWIWKAYLADWSAKALLTLLTARGDTPMHRHKEHISC
jgi:hypothetical protein